MCEIGEVAEVTEDMSDVDWRFDVVLAGEGGLVLNNEGWWPELECDHGEGWELAPKPLRHYALHIPAGTFVRASDQHKPLEPSRRWQEKATKLREGKDASS